MSDYEELKSPVLWRYNINEETYRQRFRTSTGGRMDISKKWTKDCNTVEDIREVVVIDQVINTLPKNVSL